MLVLHCAHPLISGMTFQVSSFRAVDLDSLRSTEFAELFATNGILSASRIASPGYLCNVRGIFRLPVGRKRVMPSSNNRVHPRKLAQINSVATRVATAPTIGSISDT